VLLEASGIKTDSLPAQVEEFYVLTWEAKKEVIFEMPVRWPGTPISDASGMADRRGGRGAGSRGWRGQTVSLTLTQASPGSLPGALASTRHAAHSPSPSTQTGGAAFMREGPNLLKLARKEQCMALLAQLRTKFKLDGRVYRVFPSGEVQYLHPKDGVYPEKVNKGRVGVNNNPRSIGKNVNPAQARQLGGQIGGCAKALPTPSRACC
jgi:hypothetical protein